MRYGWRKRPTNIEIHSCESTGWPTPCFSMYAFIFTFPFLFSLFVPSALCGTGSFPYLYSLHFSNKPFGIIVDLSHQILCSSQKGPGMLLIGKPFLKKLSYDTATIETSMEITQKAKNRIPFESGIISSGCLPKRDIISQ